MLNQLCLTAILELPEDDFTKVDLSYLFEQRWAGAILCVVCDEEQAMPFKEYFSPKLANVPMFFVFRQSLVDQPNILTRVKTPFSVIITHKEVWNDNFIETAVNFLKSRDNNKAEIIYGLGFVQQPDGKVFYVQEVVPALNKSFRIHQNFNQNIWFSPYVKFFWNMNTVNQFGLTMTLSTEDEKQNTNMRTNLFNIDYFAAVYEQAGFVEPPTNYIPLGFLVAEMQVITKKQAWNLHEKMIFKRGVWEKSFWSLVNIKSKWYSKYYDDTIGYEPKQKTENKPESGR